VEALPDELFEDRVDDIADAAFDLLRDRGGWRHRRVETITVVNHEQVRRAVSVDFTIPPQYRQKLQISAAGEAVVPLALLARRPLVHFDLRNEETHAVPLLTADQNALIDRELLELALSFDLNDLGLEDATDKAVYAAAGPLIESILGGEAAAGAVERLERDHGLPPLVELRLMAGWLSGTFVLWAVTREIDRRRVLKFAYDEPFSQQAGFEHYYDAPGCAEAASYHVEVAVPADLRARTTRLVDSATGAVLVTGPRDTDRPALYYAAGPDTAPSDPAVVVAYGPERGRFLMPAATAAVVVTLLVALPWAFADLEGLASRAGPAIGLVLSTSAVFSALVLRTDEHPLLRLILVRDRLCLVATTLCALLAAALLGFQADARVLTAGWGLAATAAAFASGILIWSVVRAPSLRSTPAPEQP
jgi:hypothetical protein